MSQGNKMSMFDELKKDLSKQIGILNLLGFFVLLATCAIATFVYFDIKNSVLAQIDLINKSAYPTQTLIFLMFRSSALGVLATTLLYFSARTTISSFDQAMRFYKRRLGASFLEALFTHLEGRLGGNVEIQQILHAFEMWNKNVESAFSNIKTEKGSDSFALSAKRLSEKASSVPDLK